MKALLLTAGSLFLTSVVLGNAYYQKKQFYPSVVYITKSNPSMAVLYLQAFVMVILMGKLMRKVFFGQLRAAEMEHLIERSWYAVTETCLAFTVFRDDFSPRFVSLFTLLLFLKCFHWLAEDRVDYMERSPLISWLFHLRVISLLAVLGLGDLYFINHAYYSTLIKGASVQLVFGFEYAILLTVVLTIFMKYVLHTIDLQSENPWENKAVYLLYTELVMGFIKVVLYVTFLAIMIKVHTFPLFAIRPMYLTMRAFKKALNDVIMSRRAIRNMNTLYPDATPEELQSSDNVCIICREEMTTGAKKLPCNHIFHKSCLRSWFQRQQTCPTCRMDVLRTPTTRPQQPQPQQQQAQPQVGNMFPGFPAGFPMWPPVPQQPAAAAPGSTSTPATGTTTTTTATAGASGAQTSTTDSSQAGASGSMPFMMPPFMMPMPFMVPPPVPPVDLASMTEEELQAMEGRERQHLEARIQCLRNIHTLLDAAVIQLQQYTNIITSLGLNNVYTSSSGSSPASAAASSSTPTTSSASSSNTTNSATTASSTQPVSDLSLPRPASTSSAPAAAAQENVSSQKEQSLSGKNSDKIDYNDLEGAVGFTPPTVENIPEWQNTQEEQEDLKEIRRRRVERFSSQNNDNKKE